MVDNPEETHAFVMRLPDSDGDYFTTWWTNAWDSPLGTITHALREYLTKRHECEVLDVLRRGDNEHFTAWRRRVMDARSTWTNHLAEKE
jgi:hypothetical protein